MINHLQKILLSSLLFFLSFSVIAQTIISGTITDNDGSILSGVTIYIINTDQVALSDDNGMFEVKVAKAGTYEVVISYLGKQTENRQIELGNTPYTLDVQLTPDPLELGSVIVTGTFNKASRLASSIASSTLSQKDIQNSAALGTAELLSKVTGTFVDASAGSIYTRVYSRGISASAEDDIGWYYLSLQEDGLPITNYQTTYYGPDLFHRTEHSLVDKC